MFRRTYRVDVMLIALALTVLVLLLGRYGVGMPKVELVSTTPWPAEVLQEPADDGTPEPLAAVPPAKTAAPVRFLMQNVQNYFVAGEAQRSRYTNHPKNTADRDAVADTIASVRPEVVGLVEIGGPMALDDLAGRLAARGLDYPHRKVLTREGEDRALAILSKHPIVADNSQANYGLFGTHNRKMLRGILDVTVKVPDGRKFRIIGAHLKSHKADSEDAANDLRAQEARTLALYLQDIMKKDKKTPILMYGDWNDGPSESSLAVLSHGIAKYSAMKRLKPVDSKGEEWTHYYSGGAEYLVYDQIYVNATLATRMGRKSESGVVEQPAQRRGSDHRAVWCDMR